MKPFHIRYYKDEKVISYRIFWNCPTKAWADLKARRFARYSKMDYDRVEVKDF